MRCQPIVLCLALFAVAAYAQRAEKGPSPRPNPAREAALARIYPVTTALREDDHPAIAAHNGTVWVAWVSYSEATHNTEIHTRSLAKGKWGGVERVTLSPGDYHKPAVAITEDGTVHVVWPAQIAGNWDLFTRRRNPGGGWGSVERLTTNGAPDILPQIAAAGGRLMLVWQSMREANHDIFYRLFENSTWQPESAVTNSAANDWEPVVAATADGAFHVAWDSYRGDYDVLLRTWRNGQWSGEVPVAASAKLENHASLTADSRNRLWITWEVGPEKWAADSPDGGLRAHREIGIACLDKGRLQTVALPKSPDEGLQAAVITSGTDGGIRLLARTPINKNWLSVVTTTLQGGAWSAWETLPNSEGRIDQRIVTADSGEGRVVAVYPAGSSHNVVYARAFDAAGDAAPQFTPLPPLTAKPAHTALPEHRFRNYQLAFGDLHRHTDISEDGGIPDGSLLDAMRYAVDAAPLHFLGITDHTRYLPRRYNLYRLQQIADLLYKPGVFAGIHAYERSQYTPWGHRNVVHQSRDYTPVPAGYDIGDLGVSPWGLFEALRGKKAISIPHTSAWGNKQVSWDYYDPQVERLVEIYQGMRSSYEYNGAPDPADRQVYEKDSKNFVWDALARGHKLGFIASSDHTSTHMSFAAVYTRALDRESIFEALQSRRTYAATDRIFVDFSIGSAVMGEEVTIAGTPEINVAVTGTAPLARIDIIKNGTFAYTVEPKTREAKFQFRDQNFDGKESHYYVRVIQQDKQMAWASPIWVKRQ